MFSSVAGAETNRIVPHHRIEAHLLGSGIRGTILRPGFFTQNLGGPYRTASDTVASMCPPAMDGSPSSTSAISATWPPC